ncbi:MAG: RNA polymerase sigma factor [Planctomycetota bacterium]
MMTTAPGSNREVSVERSLEAGLIRAARAGHRDAYDRLVRSHLSSAYALAYRLVGSADDAEDVVQDAFLKAHEALATFSATSSFRTWLYRIVVNAALDHLRRTRRHHGVLRLDKGELAVLGARDPDRSAERAAHAGELTTAFDLALEGLPLRMKTALVLRVIEGQSYADIAAVLGITATTCRVYVTQARKRLYRALRHLL